MAKFFKTPFASGGARTTIPTDAQSDGMMSFLEGWGYDYERNPLTDEQAKHIERGKMNYMFFIITEALGELQRQGTSTWDEEKIPYGDGAICWFGGKTWISLTAGNSDKPGITKKWKDLIGDNSGGGFDPTKYYTIEEVNDQINKALDEIKNISMHEVGDIYPIARTTVGENEYVCNGDVIPISSNVGISLSNMPEDYKLAWGIKKVGTQLIRLPLIIDRNDNNIPQEAVYDTATGAWIYENTFTVPMFSLSAGIDREKIEYYGADTKPVVGMGPTSKIPGVKHVLARFTPVIWIPAPEESSTTEFAVYFEGTDYVGPAVNGEITIRQLRFGLYSFGSRYGNESINITGLLNTLFLYDNTGATISVAAASTVVDNKPEGATMLVTLSASVSAASMTVIGRMTIPDVSGTGTPRNVSFTLTKEALT